MDLSERQRKHRTVLWNGKRVYSYLNLIPYKYREILLDSPPKDIPVFPNLYIHGEVGTGKTYLACSFILNNAYSRYLNHSISPSDYLFVSVPELLHILKRSFNTQSSEDSLRKYIDVPFLVLDDIASEKITEWVRETLDYLVDARYRANKRTIYTSNYSLDGLNERMGDEGRVVSRIKGSCEILQLTGKDRRQK